MIALLGTALVGTAIVSGFVLLPVALVWVGWQAWVVAEWAPSALAAALVMSLGAAWLAVGLWFIGELSSFEPDR